MAAEYRGFGFGRKAEIAPLDRRKRLKNHDVVIKGREIAGGGLRHEPDPRERPPPSHRRRRDSRERKSRRVPLPVSRIK